MNINTQQFGAAMGVILNFSLMKCMMQYSFLFLILFNLCWVYPAHSQEYDSANISITDIETRIKSMEEKIDNVNKRQDIVLEAVSKSFNNALIIFGIIGTIITV